MRELRLDLLEAQILARCHDTTVTRRRIVITVVVGCVVAAGFIAAAFFGVSARTIAGVAALYAVVTMFERLFHGRAILAYKSLVRKLARQIGELERPA